MLSETAPAVRRPLEGLPRSIAVARLVAVLTVAYAAALPLATACDSTSCSLLTRGENVLVPKGKFRLDLSFGYTDESVLLRGSQEVDTVLRPRLRRLSPVRLADRGPGPQCGGRRLLPAHHHERPRLRFGNQAIATAGVARPLVGRLSASLQAKLYHQDRNQYLGQAVPSPGGTFVYVNPGLRFAAPGRLSFYAFLLLVPYRNVNEAQLAPRVGVLTGVSKLF